MSGEERVAYLVKLAMEAFNSATAHDHSEEGDNIRIDFEDRIQERMRQAAQAWGADVDVAKEDSPTPHERRVTELARMYLRTIESDDNGEAEEHALQALLEAVDMAGER